LPVEVEFIVTDQEAQLLFKSLEEAKVELFYAKIPAFFGVIGGEVQDITRE